MKQKLEKLFAPCYSLENTISVPLSLYSGNRQPVIGSFLEIKPKGEDWIQLQIGDALANYYGGMGTGYDNEGEGLSTFKLVELSGSWTPRGRDAILGPLD